MNNYLTETDDLGNICNKIYKLLQAANIDSETTQTIAFLHDVCALNLLVATNRENYIGDFIPGQAALTIAEQLISHFPNPYLTSRLYDILQVNKKNKFQNAQSAISAYFVIADAKQTLNDRRDYLLRIIQVLKSLGKGNKTILMSVFNRVKQAVIDADFTTECYSVNKIIGALKELQAEPGEYADFITLLQKQLSALWSASKFECFRLCNDTLALLLPEDSTAYGHAVAEALIAEGDELLMTVNISQHLVVDKYQKALRIYKGFSEKGQHVADLMAKLTEAQQKAAIQIQSAGNFSFQLKPNPALSFPDFDNIFQAVYWLIALPLPSKQRLEQDLKNRDRSFYNQFFVKSTMADAKGNIIAVSEDNADQIYLDGRMMREIFCKTIIAPMYEHFTSKISIAEMEVAALIYNSEFVPEDRVSIFTRGIFYGFCGNIVEAVQLLVPQIENGLKELLNKRGTLTRKLDRDVQTEKSLQYYLDELKTVLSEDLVFDLDGLLNQAFGDNLRHDLAHGLCSTTRMGSYLGLYTWWLALKMSLQIQLMIKNVDQE